MNQIMRKGFALFCAGAVILAGLCGTENVYAAAGEVYSATLERSYRNPFTGEVEDAGGEDGYATGQGMVESAAYPEALIEKMADGSCYMTFKMGLADFATNHYFEVGSGGGFSEAEAFIVGEGSDANGATFDVCVKMPSENAVIRGSMFVEPMGRDVVFFLKPGNLSAGNSTSFAPQYVTEDAEENVTETPEEVETPEKTEEKTEEEPKKEEKKEKKELKKTVEKTTVTAETPAPKTEKVSKKKGLTLSTEKDVKAAKKNAPKQEKKGVGLWGIVMALVVGAGIGFAVSRRKGGSDDEA